MARRPHIRAAALAAVLGAAGGAHAAPAPAHRLAGQRIVWSFPGTTPPAWLLAGIRRGDVGAVLLFGSNGADPDGVGRLVRRLQSALRPRLDPPLLIMSDHEGGPVRRLAAPPYRGAGDLASLPVSASLRAGREAGAALCRARVNVDLAPVLDLARPGSVIARQGRSFGRRPRDVAARSAAFARGLREYGVAAVPKHFPGLGAARETTDAAPVSIGMPLAELRAQDEAPYRAHIARGVPMVMVGTAIYPGLSPRPAALATRVVRGELRGRLGFRGIVVSDALDTPALAPFGADARVAVAGARAGVDLMPFVSPQRARAAQHGLRRAIEGGALPRADAEAAMDRLLTYRRVGTLIPRGSIASTERRC